MKITKQNPLNIIAIFASLAEVAGVVMITKVPLEIQTIFIWFVMIFPIILVLLFFLVLFKKPMNFYSPDYYKNEDNFVKIISDLYDNVMSDDEIPESVKERFDYKIINSEKKYEIATNDQGDSDSILMITISGDKISGGTVKKFYKKVMEYLKRNNIKFDSLVPYPTGPSRYLINFKNAHIKGEEFTAPLEFDNFFIETHKSKIGAKKDMIKFLNNLGLDVE